MVRDKYRDALICTSATLTGMDLVPRLERMNVPDLRSPVVQKLPDAELAQVISNGQGGMPCCKGSLSVDRFNRR